MSALWFFLFTLTVLLQTALALLGYLRRLRELPPIKGLGTLQWTLFVISLIFLTVWNRFR